MPPVAFDPQTTLPATHLLDHATGQVQAWLEFDFDDQLDELLALVGRVLN